VTRWRETAVDHHLARLDARECRAFVADLWAARGFETHVDGDVVVATRRGDAVVLFPAVGGRLRAPSPPSRPVDAVVAPRGGNAAAALAETHDARVLTATTLREMLRYAVAPADAEALCERHLGGSPATLRPPLRARVRAHASRVEAFEPPASLAAVVALLALVALTTGSVVVLDGTADGGLGGAGGATDGTADATAAATATERAGDATPPGDRTSGADDRDEVRTLSGVPGLGGEGVTNLSALAAAHDRALGTRSYTLWLDTYRPFNGDPDAPQVQRDTDIAVGGAAYSVSESLERGDERRAVRAVYYDGTDWYVADPAAAETTVRRIDGSTTDASVPPDPRSLRRTLVTRYLATPVTDVTDRTRVGNTVRYRLEGEGLPSGFDRDRVYNYSFVATVGDDGFVYQATVEFSVVTVEGSYRLRFEWTYGRVGSTMVAPPVWIDGARPTTATATAMNTSTPVPTNASTPTPLPDERG
jgi:hypothetical protein